MPNRYIPSALAAMIEEQHDDLLSHQGKGDDTESDEYVPEYEAVVSMLQPEYREEFRRRTGELDG